MSDAASARRVYLAGSKGAVLFCLHGGGYSGLTWALVAAALKAECALAHTVWQRPGPVLSGVFVFASTHVVECKVQRHALRQLLKPVPFMRR